MGNILSSFSFSSNRPVSSLSSVIQHICGPTTKSSSRKRKASFNDNASDIEAKRFKLNNSDFVYQKFFVEGVDSNVQIHALGHTWRLHKIYLEQCGYFHALFHGKWSDSEKNEHHLTFRDDNICFTGLNNVFASLYNNEIEIDEDNIASICGAASLLNLTSVLEICEIHLAGYLYNKEKLLICLRLADRYGFDKRMKEAINVLKYMFCQFCLDETFLRGLQQSWLIKLFSQQFVCVRENELDLYNAIKNWIFLTECPYARLGDEKAIALFYESSDFDWHKYFGLLRLLRVSHLVSLQSSLKLIRNDGIIPTSLLNRVVCDQWQMLLRSEETTTGFPEIIDDDEFYSSCYRFGRVGVSAYSRTSWRWLGYFFGVDLLVNYDYGKKWFNGSNTTSNFSKIRRYNEITLQNVELGKFKLPPKGQLVSIHLFCLPFAPIHRPTFYWDEFESSTGLQTDRSVY
uniref:BTB domain-containing protein n=1 Tax=Meloidogyne hapla TaxID=6305 RepID=A0A1I8AZA4_MELHA